MHRILDKIKVPVVYRCSLCDNKFYTLKAFVDHLTIRHGIAPEDAWRFVKGAEIR